MQQVECAVQVSKMANSSVQMGDENPKYPVVTDGDTSRCFESIVVTKNGAVDNLSKQGGMTT